MGLMALGVQLFTLRDPMEVDFWGTLSQVRDMGLQHVELAGIGDHTPDEIVRGLEERGLIAASAHYGFEMDFSNLQHNAQQAADLGVKTVVLPWVPETAYASGWVQFAASLQHIAEYLLSRGLRFAYHHHAFELEAKENDKLGLELLFENTGDALVLAELDTYWLEYAGESAQDWIANMGARLPHIHLKDLENRTDRGMCDCGDGVLDWPRILSECEAAGVEVAYIEHDHPEDALKSVARSVDFLRNLGVSA